ncbi:hypothetical protein C5167_043773 [Papaver somniferum]|uniref:Endonuclease/exonuclease/phosphatase domain-containing protein n=1 Tax=Papaver somniferum TaxID=3469 RepID=A0A4Y7LA92_PAPSO|nr:hypothetical protein C5167_043773 [Papaver somniferum]
MVWGGTEKTTKLSTVETMDVIRMDEYEVHIAGAEKNPLQSLENHALLDDPSKPEWLLTCIYGSSYYHHKEKQWTYIKDLSTSISQPWVISGDLNLVFSSEEIQHINGILSTSANTSHTSSSVTSSSRDAPFFNLIYKAGLEDLGYSGRSFAWSSNVHGTGVRRSILDRAIVNNDWFINFPDSKLLHLPQMSSDHFPIFLDTSSMNNDKKRNWKYFQCYEKDDTLKGEIVAAWNHEINGSHAYRLSKRLVITRKYVSKLNKEKFGDIQSNINMLHQDLECIPTDITDSDNLGLMKPPDILEIKKALK